MIFLDFGLLWLCAYLLVKRLHVISAVCEKSALAFALALGFKSLILYALVALGQAESAEGQLGVSLGALIVAVVFLGRRSQNPLLPSQPSEKKSFLFVLVALILGSLISFSFANAIFFPITEADGIWYHIRGMVFLQEAGFDSATVVSQFRQYPPFVSLLFAYLLSFGVDSVKIIFPFIYSCLLVIFYCRVSAHTENQKIAACFTLILGATPYFWWHSFLPFLDLTTGFYYSIGTLYWFFLIQKIIDKNEKPTSPLSSWAVLSGTFFGLAAWSRLEFLLYNAIPVLILIYVLDRSRAFSKKEKNKILLCLAVPTLILSTLWFVTLAGFDTSIEKRVLAVGFVGLGMWLLVLINLKWNFHLHKTRLIGMGVLAAVGYVTLMLVGGPQSVTLVKALAIAMTRSISVHAFYSCTLFLGIFLFFVKFKNLSAPEKLLGWFLLFYPLMHFLIFSYSEPKWSDLSTYMDILLVHPGQSINLSDTRGMLAFYPLLIFFIAGLPVIKKSFPVSEGRWAQTLIGGIVIGNLVVIVVFFLTPRMQFFLDHEGLSRSQLLETAGSRDMPNQLKKTYKVANGIRELTPLTATIFMPPGDRLQGSFRSAATQILYPRKLIFGEDENFEKKLKEGIESETSYFVFSPDWKPEFCKEPSRIVLTDSGFGMCRVDR